MEYSILAQRFQEHSKIARVVPAKYVSSNHALTTNAVSLELSTMYCQLMAGIYRLNALPIIKVVQSRKL